jgi:flagellar basal body-associated protein FliL
LRKREIVLFIIIIVIIIIIIIGLTILTRGRVERGGVVVDQFSRGVTLAARPPVGVVSVRRTLVVVVVNVAVVASAAACQSSIHGAKTSGEEGKKEKMS